MAVKHIFRVLTVRDGEREYSVKGVHSINAEADQKDYVEELASEFYHSKVEKEDGGYLFFGGEVFVSVTEVREITQKEFEVLKNFI